MEKYYTSSICKYVLVALVNAYIQERGGGLFLICMYENMSACVIAYKYLEQLCNGQTFHVPVLGKLDMWINLTLHVVHLYTLVI